MSFDIQNTIFVAALPVLPLALGAAIATIAIAFVLIRRRRPAVTSDALRSAAATLGIDTLEDDSEIGMAARGVVNEHMVTLTPQSFKAGRKTKQATSYSVSYDAPEAPKFRITVRTDDEFPVVDSGMPEFDNSISVETSDPDSIAAFFTMERRKAIARLLHQWPTAEITNRSTHISTQGIEDDHDMVVDTICHLVAAAETFDRPSHHSVQTVIAPTVAATTPTPAPPAPTPVIDDNGTQTEAEDGDLLTAVRLDELSVIADLFGSDRTDEDIREQFEHSYRGHDVTWAGEIVKVGAIDESGSQRIASLIGSADGKSPESGRVIAVTTVGPDPVLHVGDVVSFTGRLLNLDAGQRLLHLT